MVGLDLVAEIVDDFLKGIDPHGQLSIVFYEGFDGHIGDLIDGILQNSELLIRAAGENKFFAVDLLHGFADVFGVV